MLKIINKKFVVNLVVVRLDLHLGLLAYDQLVSV